MADREYQGDPLGMSWQDIQDRPYKGKGETVGRPDPDVHGIDTISFSASPPTLARRCSKTFYPGLRSYEHGPPPLARSAYPLQNGRQEHSTGHNRSPLPAVLFNSTVERYLTATNQEAPR